MSKIVDRTNEVRTMGNGLKAEIVSYNNARNITVRFENGIVVEGVRYNNFKRGHVKCPMRYEIHGDYVVCSNPNVPEPFEFLIDTEDLEKVKKMGFWCAQTTGRIINGSKNKSTLLHRYLMGVSENNPIMVDHIDGDYLNNRKSNLRFCVNAENCRNAKIGSRNSSGYKGVSFVRKVNKWKASIKYNYRDIYLGKYAVKEDAARAYNKAAEKYFGEFARLNEIP